MSFEFNFTQEKLAELIPNCEYGVEYWYPELAELLPIFGVTTVARVAAFVAQTAHESGGYRALKENLNYKAATLMKLWPKRFPDQATANHYAGHPELIANYVYANRMGNGAPETGDGYRYCGRGLLQLTGKDNYSKFADYAGIAVEDAPDYIETPRGAVHSACWFWYVNDCNTYADASDIEGLTKRINGGQIGLADRIKHYNHAIDVLVS
jgi:putative chitinase